MSPATIEAENKGLRENSQRVLVRLYQRMLLIRLCEERLAKSHQRGLIPGACHTYVGQEAIATGVCAHLNDDDMVFSTHRGHGHALAKGLEPQQLFAELFGRVTGCSRGRGGSMHLFAPEVGMMAPVELWDRACCRRPEPVTVLNCSNRKTWPSHFLAMAR